MKKLLSLYNTNSYGFKKKKKQFEQRVKKTIQKSKALIYFTWKISLTFDPLYSIEC